MDGHQNRSYQRRVLIIHIAGCTCAEISSRVIYQRPNMRVSLAEIVTGCSVGVQPDDSGYTRIEAILV